MAGEELPEEAAALYEERPDAFVAARNALAKQLRGEGRRDDAKAVAALRRPTAAAWALNRVARGNGKVVGDALAAGEALQAATQRAVAGKKIDLRAAQDAQRRALDAVVDAVVAAGKELGAGNVDQLRTRATNTLHAAMADDEIAARLRAGTLDEDEDAPGFGFGFGAAPALGSDEEEEDDADDEATRAAERAALDAEIERRRARAESLAAEAVTAEDAARAARQAADEAAASVAEAEAARVELD